MPESLWMQMLTVIWDEIANMWWFFLLSIVLVGIIKGYKLDLRIRDSINKAGPWGIVVAVGVGMVSPLCSCGILPVVITLAMIQTPLAPLMALLVTSPLMSPASYSMLSGMLTENMRENCSQKPSSSVPRAAWIASLSGW